MHTCEIQDGDGFNSLKHVPSGIRCQVCEDIEGFEQVSAEVDTDAAYFMPVVEGC